MKTISLIFAALLISTFSFAQNETITGKITDENNNPLERAFVLLLDADDQSYVTGTVTDENGNFEIDLTDQGTFLLTADHISFDSPRAIGLLNNEPINLDFEIINHKQLEKVVTLETTSIEGFFSENEISVK
jgi:hypothetical protein